MPKVNDGHYGDKTFLNTKTNKQETVKLTKKTTDSQVKSLIQRGAPMAWFDDERAGEKDSLANVREKAKRDTKKLQSSKKWTKGNRIEAPNKVESKGNKAKLEAEAKANKGKK